MTEEVLVCPLNVEMITKSVANSLGICLKCRKGRGPYLSFRSSLRRNASLWNYVPLLTFNQIFLVTSTGKQSRAFELYFHVTIARVRPTGYF